MIPSLPSFPSLRRPALAAALAALLLAPAAAYAAASAPPAPDVRLGDDVAPTFEAVRLDLDAAKADYRGSVRVDLTVRRAVSAFRFHALGQTFTRTALWREGRAVPVRIERDGPVATATAAAPLAPGDYRLEIDFTQIFNTQAVGLYRTGKGADSYAFSQFEAADARRAFPCWDEPGFKLPYQLTLAVPAAHQAISNTPVESESVAGGIRTVVFARTPKLPSYLLAIATGPLEFTPIPGLSVPGRIVTVRGQSHLAAYAAATTPALLHALEGYFGRPYPFAKLDLIAVPEFWPGAMENAGAITFFDRVLLVGPHDGEEARRRFIYIATHELAHMWFGDLVTLAWWDDLWLNESFADWMGDKISGQVHPEYENALSRLEAVQGVMGLDARPSTVAIHRPVASVEAGTEGLDLAYNKGKAVLTMFESWIGPDVFRRGVNDYLREHAWGNAVSSDLTGALSRASGRDLGGALASFIDQPGIPLVRVEKEAGGKLRLRQERFLTVGTAAPETWRIPVGLKISDGRSVKSERVLLTAESQTVDVGLADVAWVMPNADGAGYYRWMVPREMLLAIAHGAAAGAGSQAPAPTAAINTAERIDFLGDAAALLFAGALHGDDYLDVLQSFARDPEPQVVAATLNGLDQAEHAFAPDPTAGPFAAYLRRTVAPAVERLGFAPRKGESAASARLRPDLLAHLGRVRDEAVLSWAEGAARRFLADPAAVDPSLVETALQLAAVRGDADLFSAYQKRFESAKEPAERDRFLQALGAFGDPALQARALDYALSGPQKPNEILIIPRRVRLTEAGADRVLTWMLAHYDELARRLPPIGVSR
ncbi:MAG TPA: M1 family aminopeptidase, partial [Thermoanaerobaculia bacterium]|nr:M1 family aminopeptidase [Thermoanaerobaculia bacterium]